MLDGPQYPPRDTNRTIIEFCCGNNSLLGQPVMYSKRCHVVRLTEDTADMTTKRGLRYALEAVWVAGSEVLLWGSIPCTGGTPWQHVNVTKEGGQERLEEHRRKWKFLWRHLEMFAFAVHRQGG